MSNVEDQIADIRERVARIETQVCGLQRTLDGKGGGNIVFPVAAVITILEIVKVVAERVL